MLQQILKQLLSSYQRQPVSGRSSASEDSSRLQLSIIRSVRFPDSQSKPLQMIRGLSIVMTTIAWQLSSPFGSSTNPVAPSGIQRCKLSGYSPKVAPEELVLDGYDKTIGLEYPKYDPFEPGQEYIVNPYTEQQMWIFYESGTVTMTNILRAPIIIKDANRQRKAIQLEIRRSMQQIMLYREAAMRW